MPIPERKGTVRVLLVGINNYGAAARWSLRGRLLAQQRQGHPSDGLPGVVGIGEKTATKLINQYGDLAAIQAAAVDARSKLTPAQRKRIVEGTGYLAVAPKVVSVATDVPLPTFDPTLRAEPLDPVTLEELSERWGLGTPLKRLLDTLADAKSQSL